MKKSLGCTIYAEYEQICLRDSRTDDLPCWANWIANHRLLEVEGECIGIGTIAETPVRVHLEVTDDKPDDEDLFVWDQVNECTLRVSAGRIVVNNLMCPSDEWGIDVAPGTYRVRIYYGILGTDYWEPGQYYKIAVWSAGSAPIRVLKCRLCRGPCRYETSEARKV